MRVVRPAVDVKKVSRELRVVVVLTLTSVSWESKRMGTTVPSTPPATTPLDHLTVTVTLASTWLSYREVSGGVKTLMNVMTMCAKTWPTLSVTIWWAAMSVSARKAMLSMTRDCVCLCVTHLAKMEDLVSVQTLVLVYLATQVSPVRKTLMSAPLPAPTTVMASGLSVSTPWEGTFADV